MIPSQFFTGANAGLLNALAWTALALIPALVVLLYFLKLKRQPLEVPSTYLWHRTIEDLHVNSIWQRLRRSLLLLLQLILLGLLIMACLRPGWSGTQLVGNRFIFLVDNSASMQATDLEGKSRLDVAKARIGEMIDAMKQGDVAMIISFSNDSDVVQSFSDNRFLLRRRLNQIQPTNHTTDLRQALRAADGLANPGQTSVSMEGDEGTIDVQVEAKAATLYVFSDGGFPGVANHALGNLTAKYIPIGNPASPKNVAIAAFTMDRNPENPEQQQAFIRLENFGHENVTVEATLFLNDQLQDSHNIDVPAAEFNEAVVGNEKRRAFVRPGIKSEELDLTSIELDSISDGELRLEIDLADDLAIDNVAYAAINVPRKPRVLFVSPGNDPLEIALDSFAGAVVSKMSPADIEGKQYLDDAATGKYDVIIYDRCAPSSMPQANTLFIGSHPPVDKWSFGKPGIPVIFTDSDSTHPLMQLIETSNIFVYDGFTVKPPAGGKSLMDASIGAGEAKTVGSVFAIGPREGFEDAVLGFEIVGQFEDGKVGGKTDWYKRLSFPVFVQNVINYLGSANSGLMSQHVQPGAPVTIRTSTAVLEIFVQPPRGDAKLVKPEVENRFVFGETDEPGFYKVREGSAKNDSQRFAVNLFDTRESNLNVTHEIAIGQEEVSAESAWQPARQELWKWILLVGLGVLMFEWYIYNRRVYL